MSLPELRPLQRQAVAWMASRERGAPPCGGILADNVGAGKTFVVAAVLATEPLWPTLVIVPKSLLCQWVEVLHRFGLGSDICAVASRSAHATVRASRARLVVATHAALTPSLLPALGERAWGRVVVDEAHCAKNPKSRTSMSLCALRAHARWALTATPVQNSAADLLAIARFVGVVSTDPQMVRRLYVLMRTDDGRTDDGRTDGGGGGDDGGPSAKGRRLPKLTVRTVRVSLSLSGEAEAYAEARREIVDEARKARGEDGEGEEEGGDGRDGDKEAGGDDRDGEEDGSDEEGGDDRGGDEEGGGEEGDGGSVTGAAGKGRSAEEALSTAMPQTRAWELQLRCRQAATHPAIYLGSLSRRCVDQARSIELAVAADRARRRPSSKLAFLVQDVAAAKCGCVVFCDWNEEMRLVEDALTAAAAASEVWCFHGRLSVQERDDVLASFRRGCQKAVSSSTVLIAQVKCAAQGLNLQCATRAYLMRPQWNPAVERQAIGRLHRSGQTQPVTVLRLVAKDTVDEATLRRQRRKLKCVTETLRDDEMERTLTGRMGSLRLKNDDD